MKKKYFFKIGCIVVGLFLLFGGCKVTVPGGDNGDGEEEPPVQFYVSPGGNDSNDGSLEAPWQTIQHGLDNLEPGHTLNIAVGTYRENLHMSRSGTAAKKIHLKGEDFATTILDGIEADRDIFFIENANYIEISQLAFTRAPRAGLRLSYSHYIDIHNCLFANNGRWGVFTDFSDNTKIENIEAYGSVEEHGIYISNSSDNAVIRNNIIHHNYASGIQVNADPSEGGDGISSGCLIENNLVFENGWGGAAGINLASVRDSVIQNNMIYSNYAGGIAAWDDGQGTQWGCKNLTIIHNTIYFRPTEGRWAVSLKNGSTGARIYNNILAGGRRGGFEFNSNCLTGIEIDYNIYFRFDAIFLVTYEDVRHYTLSQWQAAGYDHNSISDSPQNLFMDTGNGDFHLGDTSNAVDMGTDRGLEYDFEGTARPQGAGPDVGADEKG
ncbi:MAG: hypothetical protein GY950_19290 [bacterium]|nr:hypothetical protein [bacterium]